MDLIQAMRIFARVAETGNFTRAGEQLGLSVPVVTRSVAALESHLNVRLLNRTTRRVSLTEAGDQYLGGCRALLEQLDEIEANVARASQAMAGVLRVAASNSFALLRLGPVLASYRKRFPHVEISLTLIDRPFDLVEEGFDVGIVPTDLISSETLVIRHLRRTGSIVVASRDYLREAGAPVSPEDLGAHAYIATDVQGRVLSFENGEEVRRVTLTPCMSVNSILMLHQSAQVGMGFAILPSSLVEADLAAGNLVQLVVPWTVVGADVTMAVVYPSRRFVSPKVRSFVEHVLDAFRTPPTAS
ncbi:LysR family transcriptional regulator [Chitinasiproducens palmae]|uniref:DNA-binding transcriptional regulator, LysR family n=1 Tax=Chitinasiproducens palmae TaxID=1770053 RepID=A0A1H2PP42_9BURK|nr:LysR family transcriptional regulator [Chitinasiproducens palmae]SDV48396.1 DNA-binding transcriptional regulator, LysR family [Chitinasiproducens palmae]